MKILILLVLLFLALAFATVLMRRLMMISERLARLQNEMKRNEVKLDVHFKELKQPEDSSARDNEENNR